jgi:putative transposase
MTRRRRNSLRLRGYDYSQTGLYFITVVAKDRKHLFGDIVKGTMTLNEAGKIVQGVWQSLPKQYPVALDEFIIMPNHIHGIIILNQPKPHISPSVGVGLAPLQQSIMVDDQPKTNPRPTQNKSQTPNAQRVGLESTPNTPSTLLTPKDSKRPTPTGDYGLSDIIRFFKLLSAKRANILHKTPGHSLWQTNFHDRIIRDEDELNTIRTYIQTNPQRWTKHHDS